MASCPEITYRGVGGKFRHYERPSPLTKHGAYYVRARRAVSIEFWTNCCSLTIKREPSEHGPLYLCETWLNFILQLLIQHSNVTSPKKLKTNRFYSTSFLI